MFNEEFGSCLPMSSKLIDKSSVETMDDLRVNWLTNYDIDSVWEWVPIIKSSSAFV